MEFVHRPYQPEETIAALATPPGEGGIAIIRISGKGALDIASKVFSGPVKTYTSHTAHYGYVLDKQGAKIDEALLLVLLGPRSFTGEDTVEIQCHGGMIASKNVLERVIKAGARHAGPGEFSFKAFMNGKLDLTQAEGISALISAKNERAFEQASSLLEGALSKKIKAFQKEITAIAAIFEAWVDFPEEGLEFASKEEMLSRLDQILKEMKNLLETFHDGKKIHYGISLCIAGSPNVGKSSLMNALLDKERAIVTHIAGTTRDLLEEDLVFNGLHFRLMDTAGIRQASDLVEQEGIRRSLNAIQTADLVLFILDASREVTSEEYALLEKVPSEKGIIVWNKIDVKKDSFERISHPHIVNISVKERRGFDALKQKIDELVWKKGAPQKEELFLSSLRHKQALSNACHGLSNVMEGLKSGSSPEFLAFDLRVALFELGTILGVNVTEDILSSIFSQFCIGK